MAKQQQYLGVFEGMDFGPYTYQHYPLMMFKDGDKDSYLIVNDEEEEKAAEDDGYKAPKVGPPANVTVDEVNALTAERDEAKKDLNDAEAELAETKKALAAAQAALAAKA